jgi:hypothetical protein
MEDRWCLTVLRLRSPLTSDIQDNKSAGVRFALVGEPMTVSGEIETFSAIGRERLVWSDSATGKIVAIGLGMARFSH